ncbi:dienelactone hydrolase family protein [Algoriphagus halophytocola]|uniref:Dienelactone hydrolase family protein n=1 Tax=Algoriphagus halophytocola TaxID=2991499 RepID=A0ABY6MJ12_9BACT|nr:MULTISPECIES: dienelactone hydrolase family protein [unclassified Algoriphagus]UZD22179.1 dienelactone hydrolase family protein [Algoriphagus sp. TR-M5]WBL43430.1 dienelactone hydrolase family protein [Algoriphagus sp. TR-M9]
MPSLKTGGIPLSQAKKAAILIHGRGASAESILALKDYLSLGEYAVLAPEARGGTWYPYSFMAPDKANQVALKESLTIIKAAWDQISQAGIAPENVVLIGFSQGACLSLEFAAQNAQKPKAVIAFTGGLIGEKVQEEKYSGDFHGAQVFIGSSERDVHVPLSRIKESETLLSRMGASVKLLIFKDSNHTIRKEEIDWVNENIL